nr:MAG TPA: hypothetical protein [Caudoviricetes sp.]
MKFNFQYKKEKSSTILDDFPIWTIISFTLEEILF